MNDVLATIGELGLVPVVNIEDANDALSLGKALLAGDLPIAEITFRTAAAEDAIRILSAELPDLLVGAGTVLSVEQAQKAVKAGAKFIVSPGCNPNVIEYCVAHNIPITPGVNSPTHVELALKYGLQVLKFFPAEASGGVALLNALSAPYREVRFIPTGGINKENVTTYLSCPNVHACGGSWMVKAPLIASGQFEEIIRLVKEAVAAMLGFEVSHVGIHAATAKDARASANLLSQLFNFPINEGASSICAGPTIALTKSPAPGTHGYLAVSTNNSLRAVAYLQRKGFTLRADTANENQGTFTPLFLEQEVAGFAIRLVQKCGT